MLNHCRTLLPVRPFIEVPSKNSSFLVHFSNCQLFWTTFGHFVWTSCVWSQVSGLVNWVDPLIIETRGDSESLRVVFEFCFNAYYLVLIACFSRFSVILICFKVLAEASNVFKSDFLPGLIVQLDFQLLFVNLGSVVSQAKVWRKG